MKWLEYEKNYDSKISRLAILVEKEMTSMFNDPKQEWSDGSVNCLGYVDLDSGQCYKNKGKIVWPVFAKDKDPYDRFSGETIYLIEARQWIGCGPQRDSLFDFHNENEFYVTSIIEKNASNKYLEGILKEYQKLGVIEDSELGTLNYDKSIGQFCGSIAYDNQRISVLLDADKTNKAGCTKAKNCMKKFVHDLSSWDTQMKTFASIKLLDRANIWNEQPDKKIEMQDILDRITLESISITASGTFTCGYDDGDIFAGHGIEVSGTLKKGIIDVE